MRHTSSTYFVRKRFLAYVVLFEHYFITLKNVKKINKPNDRYRKLLLFSDLGANFERHTNDLRNVLKESYQNRRLFRQDSSV